MRRHLVPAVAQQGAAFDRMSGRWEARAPAKDGKLFGLVGGRVARDVERAMARVAAVVPPVLNMSGGLGAGATIKARGQSAVAGLLAGTSARPLDGLQGRLIFPGPTD